jgi:peptide/nickel transport system ATP-binding protein
MKIGKQITEGSRSTSDMSGKDARPRREAAAQRRHPRAERRLDEYPHELSGGMRQRVTIAIALACGPTLLFADEPTTALDVTVQAQILDLLAEQQRDRNMSMILVTHDLGVVAGRTDDIAVMYAGKVVEKAPTPGAVRQHEDAVHRGAAQSIPKLENPSHTRSRSSAGGRRPRQPAHGCRFAPGARTPRSAATRRSHR